MPPLEPTDRWIYAKVATHKLALAKKLGFGHQESYQRRKEVVRFLDTVLMDVDRAATFMVGRLLPSLARDSVASHNCDMPNGSEFKTLLGVKFPLSDGHIDRLTSTILPYVESDRMRLTRAVREPTEALDWSFEVLVKIQDILGLKIWPAIPLTWRRLREFIYADSILTACFYKQAKRYFKNDRQRCWDLVSVIRVECYLTALNTAEERALVHRTDLRAEMLGMPLYKLAAKRARDLQPDRQQLQDQQISLVAPRDSGDTSDLEIEDLLAKLPLLNRRVIRLRLAGYNDSQIADILVQFGNQLAQLVIELEIMQADLSKLLENELDVDELEIIELSIRDFESLLVDARLESKELRLITAADVRRIRIESGKLLGMQRQAVH